VFRRLVNLVITAVRQAVPVGGIFVLGWQPAVALAVYWLESVALVAIAVSFCFRLRATTSAAAIAEARAAGDEERAKAMQEEARRIPTAGVNPRDVLLFHGGSMGIVGAFFGAILLILTLNGRIEPIDWGELWDATGAMALVLGVGFVVDRLMTPVPSVASVQARVDTCNGRWAFLWLLGFGGVGAMAFTGRPQTFFQVFAILKGTWEMWALLAGMFGWMLMRDRAQTGLGRRTPR
jgi:hypothetical protein